jgi:hypothetical protein
MLGRLQRIAERCIAPTLAGLTLACAENLTSPTLRQQIHARVQVSSGAAAASNEIKALEEIEARQSRRGRVKAVFGSFEGTTRAFTLSSLLERARASSSSASRVAPQEMATAAPSVPVAYAQASAPLGISDAYTLTSSPVSSGGMGLAFAHMDVGGSAMSWGELDQNMHVTTTRPPPSMPIDMHATGQADLTTAAITQGLDTRVDVQMGECDAIGASTSHHFRNNWNGQDYWAATAFQDSPMSTCCSGGPSSPPPAELRAGPPLAISSAGAASTMKVLSPSLHRLDVGTCSPPPSGGGSGGGGGGGGSYTLYCLILDYYDGDANFEYSVTVGCWTQ